MEGKTYVKKAKSSLICPVCGSHLVFLLEKHETGKDEWLLTMKCPECLVWQYVSAENCELHLIERLCRASRRVVAMELLALEKKNMLDECTKFINALYRGHIQPMDF